MTNPLELQTLTKKPNLLQRITSIITLVNDIPPPPFKEQPTVPLLPVNFLCTALFRSKGNWVQNISILFAQSVRTRLYLGNVSGVFMTIRTTSNDQKKLQ